VTATALWGADGIRNPIARFFAVLLRRYGPQHWWPADTPFEVIVGAILTQSTAWTNVEKAIANLKRAGMLSARGLEALPEADLARLIRPSGYYNQKAKKLKVFLEYLRRRHRGSLARMFRLPASQLRGELLELHGIGEETADSILLYAGGRPAFVVDAYTRRIARRHGLIEASSSRHPASYHDIQALFERHLPRRAAVYNEFHALLVETGKRHCFRRDPQCAGCPLEPFPHRVD